MFGDLDAAIDFLDDEYTLHTRQATTDMMGVTTYSSDVESTINANIQNFYDGEQVVMGRDNSLAYRTIIILTTDRIGLGDPVYDGSTTEYVVFAYGQFYRIMMEGGVQNDSSSDIQTGYVYYRYHAELLRVLNNDPLRLKNGNN